MNNIWTFLTQTLSVSVVALLLLFLKGIMADKLSPRWQYSVWCLLALRIIIPVASNQNIFLPVPVWVEMLKTLVESNLSSAYSSAFSVSENSMVIPFIKGIPESITDWLMIVYIIGVAVTLIKYAVSYVKLRRILKNGAEISGDNVGQLNSVKLKYNLKGCKAVEVDGLSTAFVCGAFKPVLAIPKGVILDEKIVLHELLHLKYKDNLQNVFWCILRSLHWCNPLLQYAFNRIGNDMESLCDQRVLERLEGEALRDYGKILLSMANNRFARAAGTTSVSNGGKNIKRRISAIVRFKKFPKGMELVSLCIILVLLTPTVFGATSNYGDEIYNPKNKTELYRSMAYTRVESCKTVAGALDTFARGVIYRNGLCVAIASPSAEQEKIFSQMSKNEEVRLSYYEVVKGYELTNFWEKRELYIIANLNKITEKHYTARLIFNLKTKKKSEEMLACPVEIIEDNGWGVRITEEPCVISDFLDDSVEENKSSIWHYKATTNYGDVFVDCVPVTFIDYEDVYWAYEWGKNPDFDFLNEPVTDMNIKADFFYDYVHAKVSCKINETSNPEGNVDFALCVPTEHGYSTSWGNVYAYLEDIAKGQRYFEGDPFVEDVYLADYGPDALKMKIRITCANIDEGYVELEKVENVNE